MEVLSIKNLSKKYGKKLQYAVNNANLSIEKGELMALVGESGSGKTTLLRLIAGFEEADQGEISINGSTIVSDQLNIKPEKRKIGMVFQDYALFPHFTVSENIAFGLSKKQFPNKEERISEVLEMVGLKSFANRYPQNLSGGQQQRVALARALAPKPGVILLDEPFSNLDAVLKDQVREEVRNIIKRAGATALFVTHDMRDALSSADRIAILKDGKIQQVGSPRDLYEQPKNLYVANFFGKINAMNATATESCYKLKSGTIPAIDSKRTGEILIAIRPENIEIELKPSENSFAAEVVLAQYFGDHQQVHADIGAETHIVIHAHEKILFHKGDKIHLTFNPEKIHVLDTCWYPGLVS
ncbi:MAG: iron(III) transport system ATP-binding protein [Marivirga sp.]|jgi:iron(III) transport system ATP-binding protein